MRWNVAVVGATGNVGRQMLSILAEREFPVKNVYALASRRSVGREVSFGDNKILKVQDLATFDFTGCQLALFSPGGKVSAQYAPKAAAAGCVVIDNTSHFRMEEDVPLVVPEVNLSALEQFQRRNIIANPNCSTIQLVMALAPLHAVAPIKRVVVSTYQSVSGGGKQAMDELYSHTRNTLVNQESTPEAFARPIAFNVLPQIDVFMDDGFTKEEWKMRVETRKIMNAPIDVVATCVRVPVFVGHAEAVHIEFDSAISVEEARRTLEDADGVQMADNPDAMEYATPRELAGSDDVYISRLRKDETVPHGLALWVVADNVRKGAALNSVQIAEALIADYL